MSDLRRIDKERVVGPGLCPSCGHNGAADWLLAPDRFHQRPQPYRLVRCLACSLVWLENPPRADEMPYHYGRDYHRATSRSGEANLLKRWHHPRERVLKMA